MAHLKKSITVRLICDFWDIFRLRRLGQIWATFIQTFGHTDVSFLSLIHTTYE